MEIPEDKRCLHIGWRSQTQCKALRLKDEEFCRTHLRAPTLPEDERTSLFELVDELDACKKTPKKAVPPKRHITQAEYDASPEDFVLICRGTPRENIVPRCQARSKRSGERCRNASCKGKRVCRMHGGASRGPKSTENCGKHLFIHGRETRELRQQRKQAVARMRILARAIKEHGL